MAEESNIIMGWIKTAAAGVLSLVSGAVLMYVSPLVNSVIKPAKPVANFAEQASGLSVVFNDRSLNATQGWWDFGDGTALEPYSPKQGTLSHVYSKPGTYNPKLTVENFVGDENDRTVALNIDASTDAAPSIESFEVTPVTSTNVTPAMYRMKSKTKNAELCMWILGDDHPVEVVEDPAAEQDKVIPIKDAGYYTLKLVAYGNKQKIEKSQQIFVGVGNESAAVASMQVTYNAVRVSQKQVRHNLSFSFPANLKESTFAFSGERTADARFQIAKAEFAKDVSMDNVRNVKLEISKDRTKVRVSGELVKPTSILQSKSPPPTWTPQLVLTEESRSNPQTKAMDPIVMNVNVPGTTQLPLPTLPGVWEVLGKRMAIELKDGTRVAWSDTKLPMGQIVQMKNRPMRVTAQEIGGQIRLDIVEASIPALTTSFPR